MARFLKNVAAIFAAMALGFFIGSVLWLTVIFHGVGFDVFLSLLLHHLGK